MKIAVLGAGAFGTALGGILAWNGYDIDYYDSRLERERLGDVTAGAKMILLCVPSKVAPHLLPHLPKDKPLIVATKGILSDGMLADFKEYMVLSGPGFACDIKAKKKTKLTVTDQRLKEMFAAEYMEFDETADAKGVLMCGALKNVYAIKAGLMNLQPGTPEMRRYLMVAAVEMQMLLAANGADADTVNLACGKGDLKLTCGLPSRNYEFGQVLYVNPNAQPEKTVEGVSALKRIQRGEITVPQGLKNMESLLAMRHW